MAEEQTKSAADTIDWQNDPRIAFDQIRQTWIFEDPDTGAEYEWNATTNSWIPVEQPENQMDAKDLDEEELLSSVGITGKRSLEHEDGESSSKKKKKKPNTSKPKPRQKEPIKNKGIYITNLPEDTTEQELEQVFSKYGIIAEDLRVGVPAGTKRIKLYREEPTSNDSSSSSEGKIKGDALIIYFKPESVDLAIQMMDGAPLRLEDKNTVIKVEAAQYQYKSGDNAKSNTSTKVETTSTKDGKSTESVTQKKEKLRLQKKYQKLNDKLADWDDDAPLISIPMSVASYDNADSSTSKRWEKVVILKHVFTLEEFAPPDPNDLTKKTATRQEIEEDILSGAEEIGPVSSIIYFDGEPDGVVSIKFEYKEDAAKCIRIMNGRFYSGRQLEAKPYDGKARYKTLEKIEKEKRRRDKVEQSGSNGEAPNDDILNESDEDEEKRLEEFGKWLETQG